MKILFVKNFYFITSGDFPAVCFTSIIQKCQFYTACGNIFFAFAIWILALSWIDFSVAMPLDIITVVGGGILCYYFFQKHLTSMKLFAYPLMISGGVVLILENSE